MRWNEWIKILKTWKPIGYNCWPNMYLLWEEKIKATLSLHFFAWKAETTRFKLSKLLAVVGSFSFLGNKEMVKLNPNWELKNCCNHEQVVFLVTIAVCTVVILAVLSPFLQIFWVNLLYLKSRKHWVIWSKVVSGLLSTLLKADGYLFIGCI